MKKFALLSLFTVSAFAASWTGYISDSSCGAKHADGSARSAACVMSCVKSDGASPVFVADGRVLKIDGSSKDKVIRHAGRKVTINGHLEGETVTVDTIALAQ